MDGLEERQIVWEAVEDDIDDQLAGVMASVERVEKRVSALKNQEARVEELRDLMKVYQDLLGHEAKYEEMAQKLDAAVTTIAQKMATLQGNLKVPVVEPEGNNGKHGRGPSQNDYFKAVIEVLTAAGCPLLDNEIANRVKACGYQGAEPSNVYAHLYGRSKKGLIKLVGARKFALA
jgi:Trp operon repressor